MAEEDGMDLNKPEYQQDLTGRPSFTHDPTDLAEARLYCASGVHLVPANGDSWDNWNTLHGMERGDDKDGREATAAIPRRAVLWCMVANA